MKKAEITIQNVSENSKEADVVLEGELGIVGLKDLKVELAELPNKYTSLNVILKNVSRLDIAFIQLLFAFKRSAVKRCKLSFHFEDTEYLNNWFAMAGLRKDFF
jgi:ABC-type transporter Mla MlaB component